MIDQQMEIHTCSCSSSSSDFSFLLWVSSTVSAISCTLFFSISAFVFAVVGAMVGAISGALIGVRTRSGIFHGAAVGTIMGFILSAELFKASLAIFDSDDCTIASIISLIEYASNRLRQILLQGRFSPTVRVLQEDQVHIAHIMHNEVQKRQRTPSIILSRKNFVDALGNGSSCSICLQDFQLGERVCSLPNCRHNFHLECIRRWFSGHNSCPLCRTTLSRTWIAITFKTQHVN